MSEATKAVFLSYASQDAEAAKRIADALRAAGVEVWFDQNELVGGDAWDAKIRKQIKDCALLIPVISANTQARTEGYFRLEWRLADQRTHLMAKGRPFLLPVVIDDTSEAEAHVPDSFTEVQWTKLPGGETTPAFAVRVKNLLGGVKPEENAPRNDSAGPSRHAAAPARKSASPPWLIFATLGFVAVLGVALWQPWKGPMAPGSGKPVKEAKLTGPLTEAQRLVAKARVILDEGDEINRENYALAEELLKKAEILDPSEAGAWALHAQLSASLHWFSFDISPARREAMRLQASRALALAPESDEAQLAAVRVQIELDQNQGESLRTLQALVKRSPENWQAWRQLARCMRKNSDADGALSALQQALELSANHLAVVNDLINHLTNVGDFAEADRVIRELPAGRKSARLLAHDLFSELYWRGNPAAAAAAVTSWPSWFLAEDRGAGHATLAALWNRNPARAQKILSSFPRDYLRDYLFTGPRAVLSAWANEQAGNGEAAQSDWKIAVRVSERILGEFPDDREALYWKAWALARLGDRPGATAMLRLLEQREARTNGLFIFGGLAGLKAALGDIEGAVDLLANVRVNLVLNIKPPTKAFLTLNPVFDPLRNHARFQALIAAAPGPEEKKDAEAAGAIPPDKSVAVLAFANLSDDKANEYFSDGISEELLNVLAKVPGLKVSARTSAFFFKGKEVPIPEIAKQLGVAYVIEGSVRKAGDKVRITAQLIKAADGFHVWSDTFTRDLKDIFAVQDEIAGLIAKNLSLRLGADRSALGQATVPEAFELYVKGRAAWNLRTREGYVQAESLLSRAIDLDPGFARAHSALADVWMLASYENEIGGGTYGWRNSPSLARIIAKAEQALTLDPHSAEAHTSLASALEFGWKWEEAERAYRRAIELNPNYATARHWFGMLLWVQGKMDDALQQLKLAAESDPLSHRILDTYARMLSLAGRPGEALAFADKALAIQPMAIQAVTQKAYALALLGRKNEAVALLEQIDTLKPGITQRTEILVIMQLAGADAALRRMVGSVDELPPSPFRFTSLIALGRVDEALAELRPADLHEFHLANIALLKFYDPVREDPRFLRAINEVGYLEHYQRVRAWQSANSSKSKK